MLMALLAAGICMVSQDRERSAADLPSLRTPPSEFAKGAPSGEGFVPTGWLLERQIRGDLNADGKPDLVAVLKGADPACMVKTDGPSDPLDTNPRVLLVAFASRDGFDRVIANAAVIPRMDDPYMDDPFDPAGLEIRGGILRFRVTYWRSMGGWSTYASTLSFRWNGSAFRMIGFDRESLRRNSGETETISVNYLTGRAKVVIGSMEDDVDDVTRWRRVRREDAPTLERMGDGLAFEPRLLGGSK